MAKKVKESVETLDSDDDDKGEPTFTLRGRDRWAPDLIRQWAERTAKDIVVGIRPPSDNQLAEEAKDTAYRMEAWRKANAPKPWQAD